MTPMLLYLPDKQIENPTTVEINNSIRDVYAQKVEYVVLEKDQERNFFMQIEYGGKNLQCCAGIEGRIYESNNVPIDIAVKCFLSFYADDQLWKTMLIWNAIVLGNSLRKYGETEEDIRKKRIAKQENFRTEIEKIVCFFLKDIDAVQMGRNFIDTFPVDYFTDIGFISRLDNLIMTNYSQIGELLLQSNLLKERKSKQRTIFFFFNVDEPDEYLEELVMFSKVLNEQSPNIYVAYDFIRNVAIEHFAQKWEQNYKQHFNDINDLSLKTAIERYCAIETINYQDPILAGIFAYYLIKHEKFGKGQSNYVNCVVGIFADTLNEILSRKKHNNFVNKLKTPISKKKYTLQDVDSMDGQEFEKFLAEMFSKKGFETEITKATGDQGIDVIISKNGSRIGIQAKCYSGTVGNSAIQEVFAGKSYYRLDKVMVVTNRLFTDSAQQLARVNSVILWDRNILKEKIDEIFNSSPE